MGVREVRARLSPEDLEMINWLRKLGRVAYVMLASCLLSAALLAQSGEVSLRGQVTDQSGAVVPGATVTIIGPSGAMREVQTDPSDGRYVFRDLPPGTYTLQIHVKGFADLEKTGVVIVRGQPQVMNPQLVVAMEKQEITVKEEDSSVSVAPSSNASALVV